MPAGSKQARAASPRKLPSGRWKGRILLYDAATGQRHEMTKTFANQEEAAFWAQKEAVRYREDPNRKPPSEETVAAYLTRWLTIKATLNLADKTLSSYRQMAAHVIRDLGHTPLKRLSPLEIQQFYAGLVQRPLSARTVRYVHTILKMALKDAVGWGLLTSNPADRVKVTMGARTASLRIPSPGEMAQLLAATQGTRWHALWTWFAITGSRLGEALALRWTDIEWIRQTATIHHAVSGDAKHRVIKTPKTASGRRTIALGPRLVAVLEEHRGQQDIWREVAGPAWRDTGLVFTTLEGNMLTKRYVERVFKTALKRAGLPHRIRVHDLRHGMATHWLAEGKNPKMVSQRLGHSNVAFTLHTYGHVLPHDEAQVAEEMEEALFPTLEGGKENGPQTGHNSTRGPRV